MSIFSVVIYLLKVVNTWKKQIKRLFAGISVFNVLLSTMSLSVSATLTCSQAGLFSLKVWIIEHIVCSSSLVTMNADSQFFIFPSSLSGVVFL